MTTNVLIVNRGPQPIVVTENDFERTIPAGGYVDIVVYSNHDLKISEYKEPEKVNAPAAYKGVVMWFNDAKGFGYIRGDDKQELFVHFSGINVPGFRTLVENQRVEYNVQSGAKGTVAINVTPLV